MMFYFRLARELGVTLGHLLQEASSREISGWMAFLALEEEERVRKESAKKTEQLKAHLDRLSGKAIKKIND